MVKYRTLKTIVNGTTTVEIGQSFISNEDVRATDKLLSDLCEFELARKDGFFNTIEGKGVAKVHPDDTYNKETGLKVASNKAEINARNKANTMYLKLIKSLEEFKATLEKGINENNLKLNAAKKRLKEINK